MFQVTRSTCSYQQRYVVAAAVVISGFTCVLCICKNVGAIPLALTNVSELCMWYESSNLINGRTNNPYHQGRIVGGSSGNPVCQSKE